LGFGIICPLFFGVSGGGFKYSLAEVNRHAAVNGKIFGLVHHGSFSTY
jgi:hypothetical protein